MGLCARKVDGSQGNPDMYGGFLKYGGTPKSCIYLMGCSTINHPFRGFGGTPICGNPLMHLELSSQRQVALLPHDIAQNGHLTGQNEDQPWLPWDFDGFRVTFSDKPSWQLRSCLCLQSLTWIDRSLRPRLWNDGDEIRGGCSKSCLNRLSWIYKAWSLGFQAAETNESHEDLSNLLRMYIYYYRICI